MTQDKFIKNVVMRRWEATYKIGRSVEIQYIRSESEFTALKEAEERQEILGGKLVDFHEIGEKPKASSDEVWKEHDEYIAEIEKLKKIDKERPLYEIVDEVLGINRDEEQTESDTEYKPTEERCIIPDNPEK